jgi:hypothetical protein
LSIYTYKAKGKRRKAEDKRQKKAMLLVTGCWLRFRNQTQATLTRQLTAGPQDYMTIKISNDYMLCP